jgi:hypothetical protein
MTRAFLNSQTSFQPHFATAKVRISKMTLKYVEIPEPEHQYLFEFWLALKLKTQYNQFMNT